jgi:ubiquinone biosynthesis protein COQ4
MVADLPERERERLRELTLRPIDHVALLRLPEGTLGHAYAAFLRDRELSPTAQIDAFPEIAGAFERDWVFARFARVHDIHHALLGFGAGPHEELGLQAFNARNFREPHAFLAMVSLPVCALRYGDPARFLREVARGWRLGGMLPNLMTVPFEEMFEMDVDAARAQLFVPDG